MKDAVRVKFCGLMRQEDVRAALRLGADFLGFVFAPGGPRSLTVKDAQRILRGIDTRPAQRVGVFRNQPARFVNEVAEQCGLDFVQLHGDEPRDYPSAIRVPTLRVIHVPVQGAEPETNAGSGAQLNGRAVRVGHRVPLAPNVFAVLLDAQDEKGRRGGLGRRIDPRALEAVFYSLPPATKVVLAGGLTPENVRDVAERYHPYAVDVASGIESAVGVKDMDRMAAFMAALGRTVSQTQSRASSRKPGKSAGKNAASKMKSKQAPGAKQRAAPERRVAVGSRPATGQKKQTTRKPNKIQKRTPKNRSRKGTTARGSRTGRRPA